MPNSPPYDASSNARCQNPSLMGDAGEQSVGHPLINSSVDAVDGMQVIKLILRISYVSMPISGFDLVIPSLSVRDTD